MKNRENAVATCANNLRYFGPAAALRSPQTDHQRRLSGSNPDLISTAVDLDSRHRRSSVPPVRGLRGLLPDASVPRLHALSGDAGRSQPPRAPALLTAEHVRRDAALRQRAMEPTAEGEAAETAAGAEVQRLAALAQTPEKRESG